MISPYDSSFDPPLDLVVLAELRRELDGDGSSDFKETVAIYIKDAAVHLAAIQKAVLAGQAERIREEVHTLKGSSGYFGARRVQALCLQIESLPRDNTTDVAVHVTALQKEFSRVREALEREASHGPA